GRPRGITFRDGFLVKRVRLTYTNLRVCSFRGIQHHAGGVSICGRSMRAPQLRAMHDRSIELTLIAVLGALFLALPLRAKVVVDFDPDLDFSRYKTYAFIGGVENLVAIQLNPDLIEDRMHHSVVRELDKRGLHEVKPEENPGLVVRYWANSPAQLDVAVAGDWGPYS